MEYLFGVGVVLVISGAQVFLMANPINTGAFGKDARRAGTLVRLWTRRIAGGSVSFVSVFYTQRELYWARRMRQWENPVPSFPLNSGRTWV